MLRFLLILVSLSFGATSLGVSHARACSAVGCSEPFARPSAPTLPANAGGVWLSPGYGVGLDRQPDVAVLRLSDGELTRTLEHTQVDRTLLFGRRVAIRTDEEFAVGATLTLDAVSPCVDEDAGPSAPTAVRSWTITEAAPFPSTLGSLVSVVGSSADGGRVAGGAGCYEPFPAATAHVTLTPDDAAAPWLDAMVFETLVDGEVWRPDVTLVYSNQADRGELFGGSWIGRGEDVVFAACDGNGDVGIGRHTIAMRGILPDGTVVETAPVEVRLACASGLGGGAGRCAAGHDGRASFASGILLIAVGFAVWGRRRTARATSRA